MNERLQEAVEACYRAFQRAAPREIDGCPCCVDRVDRCVLTSRPLRELSAADLDTYAWKAITTIGSPEDFRYYWPRLAELAINRELLTNTEVLFGKLAYGDWTTWPEAERSALLSLAEAIGDWFAEEPLYDAEDWLCALGNFVPDVGPYLANLLERTSAARANLAAIYELNERVLRYGGLQNGFWDNAPENRETVVEWLRSDAVLEALLDETGPAEEPSEVQ